MAHSSDFHHNVVWFDIPVIDLDRAIAFYSAVLDREVARQDFQGVALGILTHGEGEVGGCLVVSQDSKPSKDGPLIYLNCNHRLGAAVAAVEQHGGEVLVASEPLGPHGFRAVVMDSEGNRVALHSE